jgi:hypothetical protein
VQEKTSQEIRRGQSEGFLFAAAGVVTPSQTDDSVTESEETTVGQRDAVGVASEVLQDLSRPGERLFRVHDPWLLPEIPVRNLAGELCIVVQFATQSLEVLGTKDA